MSTRATKYQGPTLDEPVRMSDLAIGLAVLLFLGLVAAGAGVTAYQKVRGIINTVTW